MNTIDLSRFRQTCGELVEMERSAFDSYTEAIGHYGWEPLRTVLMEIRSAHDENLDCLGDHLRVCPADPGGQPDLFSGAVELTSRIFGEEAGLMALEAGEVEAIRAYRKAIADPDLPPAFRGDLRRKILPRMKANILELEGARRF